MSPGEETWISAHLANFASPRWAPAFPSSSRLLPPVHRLPRSAPRVGLWATPGAPSPIGESSRRADLEHVFRRLAARLIGCQLGRTFRNLEWFRVPQTTFAASTRSARRSADLRTTTPWLLRCTVTVSTADARAIPVMSGTMTLTYRSHGIKVHVISCGSTKDAVRGNSSHE